MTLRNVRRLAIGFFVAYVIAVVYPGVVPLRGPRPFVLGMPLAMVWTAGWVVASFFVLLLLDRAYSRAQREYDARSQAYKGSQGYVGSRGDEAEGGARPWGPGSSHTER
jgi:hypothetical protein